MNTYEYKGELAMMAVEHFLRWLLRVSERAKPLYAIGVVRWNGKFWAPDGFEYLHAKDEIEARLIFFQTNDVKKVRAQMVAPAVGYFVEEKRDGSLIFSV